MIWPPAGDWEHHKTLLKHVFDRLIQAGLTVNLGLSKSVFGRRQTRYLRHLMDQLHVVRPDPKHVAAVVQFPRPTNAKQVRQFLGLAG